jgi:Cyclic nucleotide-binding domain
MIKNDGPGQSGWGSLNDNDRVIPRGNPNAGASVPNSGFSNSGFGNSGFSNSGFGPSGIVPSNAPGMPPSIVGLLQAIQAAGSIDTVKLTLGVAQWQTLASYLQPFTMEDGQALIEQGSKDTTVYLVESGTLNVLQTDETGHAQVAMVGPGSCVGEGACFSRMPRHALQAVVYQPHALYRAV